MCQAHPEIQDLLKRNALWSDRMSEQDAEFFSRLQHQQSPDFLWIGCSDSRVPANQIIDLPPGEVFVHRNVGNMVYPTDINAMSVIQYAVEVLKVKHILVVGHYGCGGVQTAMTPGGTTGMVDNWLLDIREEYSRRRKELEHLPHEQQVDRMCEFNVRRQVRKLARANVVQRAWLNDQELVIHGWCYSLQNGRVTSLDCTVSGLDQVEQLYLDSAE